MTVIPCRPAGAAIDHGLAPTAFSLPPHGAMARLAFVVRMPMQPCSAIIRVKWAAMPKWLELRTATSPTPCSLARRTASPAACAVRTWPSPSRPSSTASGPWSTTVSGLAAGSTTPERIRATYQPSRSMPWDGCPQSSAWTRQRAISPASAAGTPSASRTAVAKVVRRSGVA